MQLDIVPFDCLSSLLPELRRGGARRVGNTTYLLSSTGTRSRGISRSTLCSYILLITLLANNPNNYSSLSLLLPSTNLSLSLLFFSIHQLLSLHFLFTNQSASWPSLLVSLSAPWPSLPVHQSGSRPSHLIASQLVRSYHPNKVRLISLDHHIH